MKSIGRYEIISTLGKGSMGRVYKVIVPIINKIAALKILNPHPDVIEKMGIKWLHDQFIQEASIIANIRHPNVLDVWSLEENDGQLFYLMEFFCHSLGSLIGETYWAETPCRVIPIEKATNFTIEILQGLFRLHQAGIVHRDIKPFNIMLTDEGVVKITDFGLSKRRGENLPLEGDLFIGTKFYCAPEQIESPNEVDQRADLYSVGVILYRMLTGILPQEKLQLPSALNPDLDIAWDQFILKSIESTPDKRFQNAKIMSQELKHLYESYQKEKIKVCKLAHDFKYLSQNKKKITIKLRFQTDRILAKNARAIFDLNDLYSPKNYIQNDLEPVNSEVIIDKATNLIWQQSGSYYPVSWKAAKEYVKDLNDNCFGGYQNWRMPTVNELLSLLNPPPPGEDFCFESHFSSIQKWIWSGDSRSKKASWIVNFEMGFVISNDVMDFFYVKAVCNL